MCIWINNMLPLGHLSNCLWNQCGNDYESLVKMTSIPLNSTKKMSLGVMSCT